MKTNRPWPAALVPLLLVGCPGCGGFQGRQSPGPDPFPAAYAADTCQAGRRNEAGVHSARKRGRRSI